MLVFAPPTVTVRGFSANRIVPVFAATIIQNSGFWSDLAMVVRNDRFYCSIFPSSITVVNISVFSAILIVSVFEVPVLGTFSSTSK